MSAPLTEAYRRLNRLRAALAAAEERVAALKLEVKTAARLVRMLEAAEIGAEL